jgi:hypothetical protein
MQIIGALTSCSSIERVLQHLGLNANAAAFHPAGPPPQIELSFGDEPAVAQCRETAGVRASRFRSPPPVYP